jgi:V8-like Glu-specific endopeptidase
MGDFDLALYELGRDMSDELCSEFKRRIEKRPDDHSIDLISKPPSRPPLENILSENISTRQALSPLETQLLRLIPGIDGRSRPQNPSSWPYTAHGRVLATLEGQTYVGSGTLIWSSYVLTAAHNVYMRAKQMRLDSFQA